MSQLRKVYGPLSTGFVADELGCTLHQAAQLLYKGSADQQVWVRVSDLAWMADASGAEVLAWIRRHHLPSWIKGHQGRPTTTFIHLADAVVYLQHVSLPYVHPAWAYLPRWKTQSLVFTAKTAAQDTDLDWQLAQQAAWPVTVERLAEAVFSARTPSVLQQTRRLIRTWEAQGKIVCFAKGLYDLVRPEVILDPALYGRSMLPKTDLQCLRDHHPEVRHWPSAPLASAWRAYSRLYGTALLPVLPRREPTFLEYLLVRQLHPAAEFTLDARYEALCQQSALYRLSPAPLAPSDEGHRPQMTVENIEAGLIDFQALAWATRQRLQREFDQRAGVARER